MLVFVVALIVVVGGIPLGIHNTDLRVKIDLLLAFVAFKSSALSAGVPI
jgi:uncharacterized membrane protein YciS (DUF1049 family)